MVDNQSSIADPYCRYNPDELDSWLSLEHAFTSSEQDIFIV